MANVILCYMRLLKNMVVPGLIAIDYPDLMSPKTRYGDKRLRVGEIYEDIDWLAQFDGWLGNQSV